MVSSWRYTILKFFIMNKIRAVMSWQHVKRASIKLTFFNDGMFDSCKIRTTLRARRA